MRNLRVLSTILTLLTPGKVKLTVATTGLAGIEVGGGSVSIFPFSAIGFFPNSFLAFCSGSCCSWAIRFRSASAACSRCRIITVSCQLTPPMIINTAAAYDNLWDNLSPLKEAANDCHQEGLDLTICDLLGTRAGTGWSFTSGTAFTRLWKNLTCSSRAGIDIE